MTLDDDMSIATDATFPPDSAEETNVTELGSSKEQTFVPEVPLEEASGDVPDGSKDGSTGDSHRTSTRLVKFQLFETKAVYRLCTTY